VSGLDVSASSARRKLLQKRSILPGVEALSDAVQTLKCHRLAPDLLSPASRCQLRYIQPGHRRRPVGPKTPGDTWYGSKLERCCRPTRTDNPRRDPCIRSRVIVFVTHFRRQLNLTFVEQRDFRHRRDHTPARTGHEPTQELLPEQVVGLVSQRQAHLPAPGAAGGQHRGASTPVVLCDEERHLALTALHFRQYRRARLGLAGVL